MSRPLGPYGFEPTYNVGGGTPGRFAGQSYEIATGYNTDIIVGDAVKRSGSGRVIERAAAGETIIGIFLGCQYNEPDGEQIFRAYWPASQPTKANSKIYAEVIEDPDLVLRAQMSGALTAADIGQLVDLAQADGGNLAVPRSGQVLDSGTIGSGAQFKLLGLSPKYASNMSYGNQNDVLVMVAAHELHTRAAV